LNPAIDTHTIPTLKLDEDKIWFSI